MVNWIEVFKEYGVDYIEHGNHVKKGNVNINCPFCHNDTKHFLGIELKTGRWGCWWSADHRGSSAVRLLMKLLRISKAKALEITGDTSTYLEPDSLEQALANLLNKSSSNSSKKDTLEFYREFCDILEDDKFYRYLEDTRGFENVVKLVKYYKLKGCTRGDFKDRLIIPFYVDGELVTWTGRSIGNSKLRYRDLDVESSMLRPKDILFNYDHASKGGKILCVVEGQFDVLKLDYYGKSYGVRAVGLNTKIMSKPQASMLIHLSDFYDSILVLLDTSNQIDVVESMRIADELKVIPNVRFAAVPYKYKDCGELPPGRVRAFCRQLTGDSQ